MSTATTPPRPSVGPPPVWVPPAPELLSLESGIEVAACSLPARDLVAVDVIIDAPIHAEPRSVEGIASVTAQALDAGTARRDAQAFAEALESCGATLSTGVGHGGTRISLDVPARRLPDALALLAEAVTEPTFPGDEVRRLVGQRVDAIRQQMADPATRADLAFKAAAVDDGDRLARPARGTVETVGAIDANAVERFHREHAGPATTRITIGGSLHPTEARELLERAFGAWDGVTAAADPTPAPADPSPGVGGRAFVERAGSTQTAFVLGALGIDRRQPDWAALVVGLHVLGGTLTSRLDAVLREEKGYTYGVRARARPSRRRGLLVAASGSVEGDVTADALAEADRIIRTAVEGGVTDAEVDDALAFLVGVQPLRFQTARSLVAHVTDLRCSDLPADHLRSQLAALRAVTSQSASAALATHVDPDELVLAAVGDARALAAVGA